jgi:hypothetical protein
MQLIRQGQTLGNITPNNSNTIWLARLRREKPANLIIWAGSIPDPAVTQGNAWPLNLNDYVTGNPTITFAIETGSLPTGITLNANGTFSGTVTNLSGAGSVTFRATNATDSKVSPTLNWTIPPS